MIRFSAVLSFAFALTACDGVNPIDDQGDITADLDLPSGTENPTARRPIERYETEGDNGNGFANPITYNAANDTFTVDNLGFDGNNVYRRDNVTPTLEGVPVYESQVTYFDDVTGAPIAQFPYKAVRIESPSGQGNVVIVRTDAYIPYGYGGFKYERLDGVEIPTVGQASFSGQYAGLRDFLSRGDIEFATGNMTLAIDFRDFNDGYAIQGRVTDRKVFDLNGNDITSEITDALGTTRLPQLVFAPGPGVMSTAGEMAGSVVSSYYNESGAISIYESGDYFGLLVGEGADMEAVGVIIAEGIDPRYEGVEFRETGGFVLER
ncbi:MAG: hypothetical protein ACRBCL_00895 [Maritimibacter sp.]